MFGDHVQGTVNYRFPQGMTLSFKNNVNLNIYDFTLRNKSPQERTIFIFNILGLTGTFQKIDKRPISGEIYFSLSCLTHFGAISSF